MSKVYRLEWDYDHSGDSERDAFHYPFDGCKSLESDLLTGKPVMVEGEIIFQANFNVIDQIDFPLTDMRILIMSKSMLESIEGISSFKYHTIPVKMIDDTYLGSRFDSNGILKDDVPIIDKFRIVQILEFSELIDDEASHFKESKAIPGFKRYSKIVVQEPKEGFPSIFKLKNNTSKTYVPEETKLTLEAAEIKGCIFEDVEVLPYKEETT
ncbi:hypothetical protein [Portibacter lacus]|uniref:Uncharacterized protein n=1 Tax=Portibacter lacus TaxID=1099794 RepID=A0AA37STX5_9BACT|nr:hypothetical protein [Portibacter lacus]GLR20212.1 hypothetical protein GCM10007940_48280 [Portibacter lacus]